MGNPWLPEFLEMQGHDVLPSRNRSKQDSPPVTAALMSWFEMFNRTVYRPQLSDFATEATLDEKKKESKKQKDAKREKDLPLHAEKRALATLLAHGEDELIVSIN